MYNPSRGGVRGGADQFTWESVRNDKHRENYLGHSLMAPVGRWQKGKDLSWYAKERNEANGSNKNDKSELASIRQEEEEAMLIALGHNIVRKTQPLSKEDISEVLKRNTGKSAENNFERVNGVGASSQRVAILSGVGKNPKQSTEGVAFETYREKISEPENKSEKRDDSTENRKKKNKKKSKKHKKEKKHKKHHKESYESDSSDNVREHRTKHKADESDSDNVKSSKPKSHKKSKHKHREYSSEDSGGKHPSYSKQTDHKRHKKPRESVKRQRHDTSESD